MNGLFDLTGKVSIVTGASRGLGRAMAVGLAKAGSSVVVADMLGTNETVTEIKKTGRKTIAVNVDVSKKDEVQGMVNKALESFGRVDILVNNAGIFRSAPAEEVKEEDWGKVIDVNLTGQFLCAQAAGREMIRQKSGKIINISSIAGKFASAESVAYCASKAGLILMTKTLAVEWGKHNIHVNAICPGIFATPMTEDFTKDESFMRTVKTRVPLSRCGEPVELVGTVIYLASRASDYMTGHALVIDGGWTAGL